MLFLKRVESEKKCDIEIDYYVPITITVGAGSYFGEKIYTRNGFCDQIIDFFVYLSPKDITIKFQKEIRPVKCVQLGRVRFSFDKEEKLICITVFDLSDYEYCELKAGMKIEI